MAITPTITTGKTHVVGNKWRVYGTLDSVGVTDDDCALAPDTAFIHSFRANSSLTGRPQAFSVQLNTDSSGTKNGTVRMHASDQTETTVDFEAELTM